MGIPMNPRDCNIDWNSALGVLEKNTNSLVQIIYEFIDFFDKRTRRFVRTIYRQLSHKNHEFDKL